MCFGCLTAKHAIRKCKSKEGDKGGCEKKHNSLLNFETRNPLGVRPPNLVNPSTAETTTAEPGIITVVIKPKKKVFLSIVPVTLSGPDGEMDTYAFLDSGSTVTLIATHVAMQLGLKGEVDPLQSQRMNKATLDEASSERIDSGLKNPLRGGQCTPERPA